MNNVVVSLFCSFVVVFVLGVGCGSFLTSKYHSARHTPDGVEVGEVDAAETPDPLPTTIVNVDGSECWFANYPVLHYAISDQRVDVEISCRTTIIDAYLPAIERTQ